MRHGLLLTPVFILVLGFPSYAQSPASDNLIVKGIVVDKEAETPLAYVSVGVLSKPLGTVSDTTGHFSFTVTRENLSDTLQISIVGYAPKKIQVKDFLNADSIIRLTGEPKQLDEVIVFSSNARENTEVVGRQGTSKLIQVSIHNKSGAEETIGSEMGMRYKTDRKNVMLKDYSLYVSANNFNFIKFRINIYSVKGALPDTLICKKQIFATVGDFKTGWTKIDLEQYHIKVPEDFIITVQWVESRMDKKEVPITVLPVAITPFAKNCYARVASQDKWKRMGVSLSSFVTIAY